MRQLISYYDEGWRYGYAIRAGRKWATVEKILPIGSTPTKRGYLKPTIEVPLTDIRIEENQNDRSSGKGFTHD